MADWFRCSMEIYNIVSISKCNYVTLCSYNHICIDDKPSLLCYFTFVIVTYGSKFVPPVHLTPFLGAVLNRRGPTNNKLIGKLRYKWLNSMVD